MTTSETPNYIRLRLLRNTIEHIIVGKEKHPVINLIVEEDTNFIRFYDFIKKTHNQFKIVDVIPVNETKADLVFTNFNAIEFLNHTIQTQKSASVLQNAFPEIAERIKNDVDSEGYDVNNLVDFVTYIKVFALEHMANLPQIQLRMEVTLAEAHIALSLSASTGQAPFIVTTEDTQKVQFTPGDCLAILCYPEADTAEYFEATGLMMQKVVGYESLNISGKTTQGVRASIVTTILALAKGDKDTLIRLFSIMNPLKKSVEVMQARVSGSVDARPTPEDIMNVFFLEAVDRLYNGTSTGLVASILQTKESSEEFLEKAFTLEQMFEESGLDETFGTILDETIASQDNIFLMPPTETSSDEDIISYYMASIHPDTFPESMRPLVGTLELPALYEHDWANDVGIYRDEDDASSGSESAHEVDYAIAQLITVAVRYARMEEIVENTDSVINPIGVIMQSTALPGEQTDWIISEGIRNLAYGIKSKELLLHTILSAGLTRVELNPETDLEALITGTAASILHLLGHVIMEDELRELYSVFTANLPIASAFLSALSDIIEKSENGDEYGIDEEDQEEEYESGACGESGCESLSAVITFFSEPMDYHQLVDELIEFIKIIARVHLLRDTDAEEGSPEWVNAALAYYDNMVEEVTS